MDENHHTAAMPPTAGATDAEAFVLVKRVRSPRIVVKQMLNVSMASKPVPNGILNSSGTRNDLICSQLNPFMITNVITTERINRTATVSYTHLDVYKRQLLWSLPRSLPPAPPTKDRNAPLFYSLTPYMRRTRPVRRTPLSHTNRKRLSANPPDECPPAPLSPLPYRLK